MATIQIILQAINDASGTFNDVAGSLEKVAVAEEAAATAGERLSEAQLRAAQSAVDAIGAYEELRASANDMAVANVNAANASIALAEGIGEASRGAIAAAYSYSRLSDAELEAANAAVAAMGAQRGMAEALAQTGGDALLAAANVRVLSQEEIDAANAALRTAFAVRALDAAEIDSINSTLAWREALTAAGDAETGVAVRAGVAAAALTALNATIGNAGIQARNALTGFNLWQGAFRALNQQIPLWGGLLDGLAPKILTQVGAWHVWADAIIEVIAVWAGAAIAASAFALAASDAFNEVVRQVTNMHTVSDATGQSFNALTGNLEALHNAVRPEVYQIAGDALTVLAKKGGELNTVIEQTGKVFDDLAARAAVAIQGSGFSSFTQNAVTDVRLLGTAFGNLFGILGNLVRMNQGWAAALLQAGTAVLGLVEHVTGLIIPLGQLLVLGHGFVLWVGLGVTAALKFGQTILGWGAAIGNAVTGFFGLLGAIRQYIAVFGIMDALSLVNPMVWVGIAVGAIAGLVFWLSQAKDGVQQWSAAEQQAITSATSLSRGVSLLTGALATANTHLDAAQNTLKAAAQSGSEYITVTNRLGVQTQVLRTQYQGAYQNVQDYSAAQQQLSSQLVLYNTRVGALAKTYGGTTAATGLLTAAGITMSQMLNTSGSAWAIVQQEVAATSAAYRAMGQQSGVLGNDLDVLNKQATDQYQAMQKLNQAWDTQTSAVTGTQSSFDTIAQGFSTLSSSSTTLTTRLGNLEVTGIKFVKSGIDSLTTSGIALNQAFTQQVGNVNSMADSWRSAGVSQNLFKEGLAASIAPMEQYAAGSSEATAQLVGLAEEAGYQGPNSLNSLNQFLGITSGMLKNTSGDMQKMKDVANQATIQEALLTGAMQAQGAVIANQLIGDINQAILKYDGVAKAAANYGNAVAQFGRQSTQAQTAADSLTKSIIAAGKAAGDSTTQIAAMVAKVLGIPAKVALQIVMQGTGLYTITGKTIAASQGLGGSGNAAGGLAAGGRITGPGGPRSDTAGIFALSNGEWVIQAASASRYGHAAMAAVNRGTAVIGLADGGPVLTGNRDVLTGQQAVTDYTSFRSSFTTAMVGAMRKGMNLYDAGGLLPPGVSVANNQTGSPELILPNAIVQGFTMGMQELHSPLTNLTSAVAALTTATTAAATASTATATATTAATTAAKATAAVPQTAAQKAIALEQAKLASDKANAAMLASHLAEVKEAIKTTPITQKGQIATDEKLEKTIQAAMDKANAAAKADQKTLNADIKKENEATVEAMRKQINAITKLLDSGSSATSQSGLWATLAADEKELATAVKALTGGTSGGSSSTSTAAAKTATATTSSAATLATIKSQIDALYTQLDAVAKGSAASNAIWAKLDKLYAQEDALTKTAGGSTKTTAAASGGTSASTGSSYTVVVDRKAESDLDEIVAQLRTENATLLKILATLGQIETEAAPAAQAKALGPVLAAALNTAASRAAGSTGNSTRRG